MIEVNGDMHPLERGRGARRSVTVRLDGDQGQAQQPNGAGGRGVRPSLFGGLGLYVRL